MKFSLRFIKSIITEIKDVLFPKICVGCNKEGSWLCSECCKSLPFSDNKNCLSCSKFLPSGSICRDCSQKSYLDDLVVLYKYEEKNIIARLIKLFKYSGVEEIVDVLEKMAADFFWEPKRVGFTPDVLVPVPLHPRRERERGYNQAYLITKIFAYHFPEAVLDAKSLVRKKYTEQQAKLAREKRMLNIQDVFAWAGEGDCPAQVLLVDDVYTTGSTMEECAKTLKQAGAREVWGIVLARG